MHISVDLKQEKLNKMNIDILHVSVSGCKVQECENIKSTINRRRLMTSVKTIKSIETLKSKVYSESHPPNFTNKHSSTKNLYYVP